MTKLQEKLKREGFEQYGHESSKGVVARIFIRLTNDNEKIDYIQVKYDGFIQNDKDVSAIQGAVNDLKELVVELGIDAFSENRKWLYNHILEIEE